MIDERLATISCNGCKKGLADVKESMAIHVNLNEVYRRRERLKAWRVENPGPVFDLKALESRPDQIAWAIHCDDCNPHATDDALCCGCYWFDVSVGITLAQIIDWTAHLWEKDWFHHTDWPRFCRRVIEGHSFCV